jgi:tetratricopeptide (TPR) repeat protein
LNQQTRDWYLARWLVVRGICNQEAATAIFRQSGDFVQNLQLAGILEERLWTLFKNELESRGSAITPPSESTMLRSFRNEGRLPKLGDTFASFQLIEELGRGGMGAVFKVRRLNDQKIFALKMILAGEQASVEHKERFKREIEALKRLNHANIISACESGAEGPLDYYTMDIIDGGQTLLRAIEDRHWGLAEGIDLLAKAALALDYAHLNGVIHRDVKPSNIMVDEEGKPWIVDFGLARDVDRVTRLTQSGAFLGTPSYMSPEQCVESSKVDGRSDVYSLGAILYELLTGHKPFETGSVTSLMAEILNRVPDRPSTLKDNVDKNLESICMKALMKEPGHRYQSAAEFAADLSRARAGERAHARALKHPMIAALSLSIGLALAIIAVILMFQAESVVVLDSVLEGRAREWAPVIKRFEEQLQKPGSFKIMELKETLELPIHSEFENGEMPQSYRLLLGRLACLEGELALRLGDVYRAKEGLDRARKLLRRHSSARYLSALDLLLQIQRGRGDLAQLQRKLGKALVLKRDRGDLLLARGRVHFRAKEYTKALFNVDGAGSKGFTDQRLHVSILTALGKWPAIVEIIEKEPGWERTDSDARAFFHVASRDLKQHHTKLALPRLDWCLEGLKDEALRAELRDFMWAFIKRETAPDNFREFARKKVANRFFDICQFMDRHFGRQGIPNQLPQDLAYIATNLDGLDGDFDRRCFLIFERACLWDPTDKDLWLRLTGDRIAEHVPQPYYKRLLKYRKQSFLVAKKPRDRVQLSAQYQRIYYQAGLYTGAIENLRVPNNEDFEVSSLWASEWAYWRARTLVSMGDLEKALKLFERVPNPSRKDHTKLCHFAGRLFFENGQNSKALDFYFCSLGALVRSSPIRKWKFIVGRISLAAEKQKGRIAELERCVQKNGPGPRILPALAIWSALCQQRLPEARALLKAQIEKTSKKRLKMSWQALLTEINRDSKNPLSKKIKKLYLHIIEEV